MKKKTVSVLLCGCFAAAVFAGCSESSTPAATAEPTTAPTATAEPEAAEAPTAEPTAEATAAPVDNGEFANAMNKILDVQSGSAGCSLRSAAAADAVVRYCCAQANTDNLNAQAAAWRDGLTDTQKDALSENWSDVLSAARKIASDPDSMTETLNEAGGNSDYSGVDLTRAEPALVILDGVFGGNG